MQAACWVIQSHSSCCLPMHRPRGHSPANGHGGRERILGTQSGVTQWGCTISTDADTTERHHPRGMAPEAAGAASFTPKRALAAASSGSRGSFATQFAEIVADIWHYRELLYQLTLRDVRIRYKQAVMGFLWAIFMPALIIIAGLLVKYVIAYLSGTPMVTEGVAGLAVKALPWAFFVGAVGFATSSLIGNITLVTKVYFPREVLPLSSTLAQAFDSSIGALTLAVVLPLLGISLSVQLLWVPVLAVLLFMFTLGACTLLSCANLFFRDVKYIVQVLLMFGIFFTPVLFEPAMFGPVGSWIIMLNPLSPILEGLRLSTVEGHNLIAPLFIAGPGESQVLAWSPWYLFYGLAWAVGVLLAGSVIFHRLQFIFAEYA
jgi:lipopolysaccharide transport system permease protein